MCYDSSSICAFGDRNTKELCDCCIETVLVACMYTNLATKVFGESQ